MYTLPLSYGIILVVSWLICVSNALHASEAGVVDWHKPFVGVPLTDSLHTSPVFHRIFSPDGTTHSLLYTATSSNTLAAIDPLTGDIAWRYLFEVNDPIISFRAQGSTVVSLSGPGGAVLRTFDASTGHLITEKSLHKFDAGRLFEPAHIGCDIVAQGNEKNQTATPSDVLVLSNGHVLAYIDGYSGEIKWSYSSSNIDMVVYSKTVSTTDAVYIVGLSKSSDNSYKIHVVALSPVSGEVLATAKIPSVIKNGLTDFLVLSDKSNNAYIVWLQDDKILSIPLTHSLDSQASVIKGTSYKSIKDVGLNGNGLTIAYKADGSTQVISIHKSDGLKASWDFVDSSSSAQNTDSLYAGGLDKDGYPYIARIFWSHNLNKASAHIFSPHSAEGKGMLTGFTFPFNTASHGIMNHVALDVANPSDTTVVARMLITTSTGAVQLWQHDRPQWTREESLSEIEVAEYVDIPEQQVIVSQNSVVKESLGGRLIRQAIDTRNFPSYIIAFVKRFVTGSYASVTASAAADVNSSELLARDVFGFRKVIIAATSRGKLFGINSGNGAILWSRHLGLGWAAEVGGHHQAVKIFVTRTVSDGLTPQIVLITQRLADNGLVDTVAFHVEALTGADVLRQSSNAGLLEGVDVVPSEMLDAFMLPGDERTVAVVDTQLQVNLYPDTDERKKAFSKVASKIYFPLRGKGRILGHQISSEPEISGKFMAYSTWATPFSNSEEITSLSRRSIEPVASLGKVLGDRRTLYKYLNPHLVTVTTMSTRPNLPQTCNVYVIDGAKGSIIYHATVPAFVGGCQLFATLTENWLIYSYYDGIPSALNEVNGYRIVSVEFYEGKQINDKTKSSETSIYSNTSATVSYYEEAYIIPSAITSLAVTSTKFGIANKDLIVANSRNQIQSFMRRLLDPRRPKRKVTSQEAEEWLIQYDPVIPDDPRRIISHNYPVAKIRHILTSPALLESTSLVFSYGLDLFSSRVAPSNTFDVLSENFNKLQLVLTVTALIFAILITRPMVARKKLRESWYN